MPRILFTAPPNFLFLNNSIHLEKTIPTAAIYALSAVLEQAGYPTDVVDPSVYYARYHKKGQFEALVRSYDVLCISANTITWPVALFMIERAASVGGIKIVLGGVHATYCDHHIMAKTSAVDVIVRGEGERTLPQLMSALEGRQELATVRGISYRDAAGKLHRTPDQPPLTAEELDQLPLPLMDRIPDGVYDFLPAELSRGCRFACSFCSILHKHCWRCYGWDATRRRLDLVLAQLPRFKQQTIMFSDDCFTSDTARVGRMAQHLEAAAPEVAVAIEARVTDVLKPQTLEALARLNVGFIQLGVECGYADGLRRIGKGVTLDQVIQTADRLREVGITRAAKYSYIVGLPWESLEQMKRTLAFAMQLAARYGNMVQVSWYMLCPGNRIFDDLLREKLVSFHDFDAWNERDHSLFFRSHPTLTQRDYHELKGFASHLERTYPWVPVLGNVFKGWFDHSHLPVDITVPGPGIPSWAGRRRHREPDDAQDHGSRS